MRTRIIVDSTADLMPEILDRVHVVPLTVHFGEEELVDGVTIDKKTFYERLVESDVLPSTSQATPEAFMREFEKAKQYLYKLTTKYDFQTLMKNYFFYT